LFGEIECYNASGRFDRLLYVGPPNETDREAILKIHLRKIPCSSDICLKELASITKGYTGADISLICREAAIAALEVRYILVLVSSTKPEICCKCLTSFYQSGES